MPGANSQEDARYGLAIYKFDSKELFEWIMYNDKMQQINGFVLNSIEWERWENNLIISEVDDVTLTKLLLVVDR